MYERKYQGKRKKENDNTNQMYENNLKHERQNENTKDDRRRGEQ